MLCGYLLHSPSAAGQFFSSFHVLPSSGALSTIIPFQDHLDLLFLLRC
jgi:hypothetical protein